MARGYSETYAYQCDCGRTPSHLVLPFRRASSPPTVISSRPLYRCYIRTPVLPNTSLPKVTCNSSGGGQSSTQCKKVVVLSSFNNCSLAKTVRSNSCQSYSQRSGTLAYMPSKESDDKSLATIVNDEQHQLIQRMISQPLALLHSLHMHHRLNLLFNNPTALIHARMELLWSNELVSLFSSTNLVNGDRTLPMTSSIKQTTTDNVLLQTDSFQSEKKNLMQISLLPNSSLVINQLPSAIGRFSFNNTSSSASAMQKRNVKNLRLNLEPQTSNFSLTAASGDNVGNNQTIEIGCDDNVGDDLNDIGCEPSVGVDDDDELISTFSTSSDDEEQTYADDEADPSEQDEQFDIKLKQLRFCRDHKISISGESGYETSSPAAGISYLNDENFGYLSTPITQAVKSVINMFTPNIINTTAATTTTNTTIVASISSSSSCQDQLDGRCIDNYLQISSARRRVHFETESEVEPFTCNSGREAIQGDLQQQHLQSSTLSSSSSSSPQLPSPSLPSPPIKKKGSNTFLAFLCKKFSTSRAWLQHQIPHMCDWVMQLTLGHIPTQHS